MIRRGIAQPMNLQRMRQSANEGAGVSMHVWMNERMKEWINLSIIQPINQRANGPIDGPFSEAPIEPLNE